MYNYRFGYKYILMVMICILLVLFGSIDLFGSYGTTNVVANDEISNEEWPNVLVIFSSRDDEMDEHQRMLDMLLGHFTANVTFISSSLVEEQDLDLVDYLFYYGHVKEVLPRQVIDMVNQFDGTIVTIGENADQFGERFSFIERSPTNAVIDEIELVEDPDKQLSFVPQYIFNISVVEDHHLETLLFGKKDNVRYPLFVKKQFHYYFASNILKPPFSILFAEVLYDVFKEDYREVSEVNPGYIRLEDIHPLVDPDHMMDIAHILAEKNIPYMIAVIPVYTNPETKKQYHFSDSPKLLKALKFMQDNGGSIVLHGYTHQFRLSETGEGFEFWDVENNMPIYHGQDDEVVVKTEEDFSSIGEYEEYLSDQKAYERDYIEERITRGIEELANYGLYALAFEAPHYTMSQHGYQVVSEYFTTYVGQLQLSDNDWEIMTTSPYITEPNFLHGMKLLPETMGYVLPEDPDGSIETMIRNAENYRFVREGMVAGFYHPYLGPELFIELIEQMEKIPNVSWIDLKKMDNHVQTKHVDIRSGQGEINANVNYMGLFLSSTSYIDFHVKNVIVVLLWCFGAIGAIAVVSFILYILSNSISSNQVERRKAVG
ncbi:MULTISPECIES: polysaccharide deacetylase family protein [Bacillaceae]|uniref:Polysaccharide deacetylase family protein n=1 Tax=Evansella alkalicola TaxID=745819 RepID=A0ABS6JXI7_9BACI|nr:MULTISPECIES: polysaccharide deacetylase family protein [Bacillaceae]MBU9723309.1 polysaccharide deacetylase family protein [Bacillus alkalicola]